MMRLEQVRFSYGDHAVLTGVDAELSEGQITALCGPNGAGKTTLFRCCLGQLRGQGRIRYGSVDVASASAAQIARTVAYVPQHHEAVFAFSVWDVVLMGRAPHVNGLVGPGHSDQVACAHALELLGLTDIAERRFQELSGGQQQLVLIARAVAQDCPYVLLDEPTASLDFGNQMMVWEAIGDLARRGCTVVVCTHDPNHVLWFTEEALVLGRDGKVIVHGPSVSVFDADVIDELYPGRAEIATLGDRRVVLPSWVGGGTTHYGAAGETNPTTTCSPAPATSE